MRTSILASSLGFSSTIESVELLIDLVDVAFPTNVDGANASTEAPTRSKNDATGNFMSDNLEVVGVVSAVCLTID